MSRTTRALKSFAVGAAYAVGIVAFMFVLAFAGMGFANLFFGQF